MRWRLSFALLLWLQLMASSWCQNPSEKSKNKYSYSEIQKAPASARTKRNPLGNDPDAIVAGGIVYEQHCSACHGMKAEGGNRGPNLLVSDVQSAKPGAIFWILTNGVVWRGMPVWSKLPEPQRWQLVSFLKSLRKSPS